MISLSIEYFNEFGDSLSFHDKPHRVVIEFYTQKTGGTQWSTPTPDEKSPAALRPSTTLFFTYPVVHTNSDDDHQDSHRGLPRRHGRQPATISTDVTSFPEINGLISVPSSSSASFPPQQMPQAGSSSSYADQTRLRARGTLPPDETPGGRNRHPGPVITPRNSSP